MIRILLVDDRSDNRRSLRALLQANNIEVDDAPTGAEALVRARQVVPDLVLVDLALVIGHSLLRRWKADPVLQRVPFVVLADTYISAADAQLGLEVGADAFLLRPVEPAALLACLREVLLRASSGMLALKTHVQNLFSANPQPMWIYDVETLGFLDVNDAAVAKYGWTKDEFLRMTIADIRPPQDIARLRETAAQLGTDSVGATGVWRHVTRTGTLLDVDVRSHAITFDDRPARLVLALDVTERRRAEQAERESEHLAQTVLDALSSHLAIVDDTGTITAVNQAWRRFAESNPPITKTVCEGANYLAVCDAVTGQDSDTARGFAEGIRAVLRGERTAFNHEYPCHSPDKQRWFIGRVTPLVAKGPPRVVVAHVDVTERTLAELRVRESARLAEMASRLARLGGWEFECSSGSIHCSAEVCRILAIAPGTPMTLEEHSAHYAPEWRDRFRELVMACVRHGTSFDQEMEIVTSLGERLHVRLAGSAVRDATGAVTRVEGVLQDIHSQRLAEQALLASDQRFRATFEQAGVGIAHVAPDGRFLLVNQQLCEMVGYSRGELLTRTFQDITHPDDLEGDLEELRMVLEGARSHYTLDKRYIHKEGHAVRIQLNASLVRKQDGSPDYFVSIVKDVSRRSIAEDQLRKLSLALEQSHESVLITDLEANIEYVNEAFVRSSGYSRDEVLGRNPAFLLSDRMPKGTYESIAGALAAGCEWRGEFITQRKDGTEFYERAVLSPLRQADGTMTHYVSVREDITERKALDDELARHRNHLEELVAERTGQLAEAQDLAVAANRAKSAFLANMSHEIRTPMNGVLGMVDVLANSDLTENQAEIVQTIQNSGTTLLRIIDNILDFSKIEAGRIDIEQQPISVGSIAENACDGLLSVAAGKGVVIDLFVAPEIPQRVLSDEVHLRQILFNLLGNAVKFSAGADPRGRVSLSIDIVDRDPLRLAFVVSDNGVGMSDEVVDRLFTPFTQAEASTTRRFGGTGLGLAICRRLADLMDGDITVRSLPGRGATFTLTLPFVVPADQPPPEEPVLAGIDCLVLPSVELDLDGICRYLQHAGARTHRVADIGACVDRVPHLQSPAIVVRDAQSLTPAPDGFSGLPSVRHLVIKRGRRRRPRIDEAGVVHIDAHPVRRDVLVRAVAIAAGREGPLDAIRDAQMRPTVTPLSSPAVTASDPILVAEDDAVNRTVILRQLELLGLEAEMASNGAEALKMWHERRYALLLTDLHMPEMDGYELTESIRLAEAWRGDNRARLPIIALTANALRGEAERALVVGMDDYLTKPLTVHRLREALAAWLPADVVVPGAVPERVTGVGAPATLDVAELEKLVGDSAVVIREVLIHYLNSARELQTQLRQSVTRRDPSAAGAIAHKLKSSSRAVGATALGTLCAQIERAGNAGEHQDVADGLVEFEAEFSRVDAAITHLLAADGEAGTAVP